MSIRKNKMIPIEWEYRGYFIRAMPQEDESILYRVSGHVERYALTTNGYMDHEPMPSNRKGSFKATFRFCSKRYATDAIDALLERTI